MVTSPDESINISQAKFKSWIIQFICWLGLQIRFFEFDDLSKKPWIFPKPAWIKGKTPKNSRVNVRESRIFGYKMKLMSTLSDVKIPGESEDKYRIWVLFDFSRISRFSYPVAFHFFGTPWVKKSTLNGFLDYLWGIETSSKGISL